MGKVIVDIPIVSLFELMLGTHKITDITVSGPISEVIPFDSSKWKIDAMDADIASNRLMLRMETTEVAETPAYGEQYPRGIVTMKTVEEKAENDS